MTQEYQITKTQLLSSAQIVSKFYQSHIGEDHIATLLHIERAQFEIAFNVGKLGFLTFDQWYDATFNTL